MDDATNTLNLLHQLAAAGADLRHGAIGTQAAYSATPTRTGSGESERRTVSRTPSLIRLASAISPAVLADPELTRARVCFDEIRAPSPRLYALAEPGPLDQPGRGHLDQPVPGVPAGHPGIRPAPGPRRRLDAASAAASSTGLTKNEPTLRVSGSAGSMTIPLRRRELDDGRPGLGALHLVAELRRRGPRPARRSGPGPSGLHGEPEGHAQHDEPAGVSPLNRLVR